MNCQHNEIRFRRDEMCPRCFMIIVALDKEEHGSHDGYPRTIEGGKVCFGDCLDQAKLTRARAEVEAAKQRMETR